MTEPTVRTIQLALQHTRMREDVMQERLTKHNRHRNGHHMWVIYVRQPGEKLFFPARGRVHIYALPTRKAGMEEVRFWQRIYGKGNVYLQKVGPIR